MNTTRTQTRWLVGIVLAHLSVTLAHGALIFGPLNHFVFRSPDHVTRVEARWQPLFATTAALLAVTEATGAGLAVHLSRRELQS